MARVILKELHDKLDAPSPTPMLPPIFRRGHLAA